MSYTAENGNFEGRSRAHGGFGNESGQTDRRGRSGEAARENFRAMARAAALSAPPGPFKSPVYDMSWENLAKLAQMVGPMIANPGIGLAAPVAQSILNGTAYGAFGIPKGWSTYSPRDIDPLGNNPRGNIGARDLIPGRGVWANAQRQLAQAEAIRRRSRRPQNSMPPQPQSHVPPVFLSDAVAGLPAYGATMPGYGKASGYGGVSRAAPIAFPR